MADQELDTSSEITTLAGPQLLPHDIEFFQGEIQRYRDQLTSFAFSPENNKVVGDNSPGSPTFVENYDESRHQKVNLFKGQFKRLVDLTETITIGASQLIK